MMPTTLDPRLLEQLMRLPDEQRSELAGRLIDSLDDCDTAATPEAVQAAWVAELNRRADESDRGSVASVPFDKAWTQIVAADE